MIFYRLQITFNGFVLRTLKKRLVYSVKTDKSHLTPTYIYFFNNASGHVEKMTAAVLRCAVALKKFTTRSVGDVKVKKSIWRGRKESSHLHRICLHMHMVCANFYLS